jgi:hypothetical protein
MARFGFQVKAPPATAPLFARNERRYGLADLDRAQTFGYHVPELTSRAKQEPELSPEAYTVASGTGPATVKGQPVPQDGCLGEAKRKLTAGAAAPTDPRLVDRLGIDANQRAKNDSRVRKVEADWSACMKAAGYDYRESMAANDDPSFGGEKISDREIATATADVRCKIQANLVATYAAVETAYQQRLIRRNSVQLNVTKAELDTRLKNASRVLGTR